ncbi:MAG: rhodanese-like domain-containing protein [Gemmatimonadota bacterium]|nr:rhodanese-like domain-containing protein [Gemmatimonadota bacterium]
MLVKTGRELIAEAKLRIREVSAPDVQRRIASGESIVLLDIREANEWNLGHIPGAKYLARGILETNIEAMVPRDATVVLYCASGNRSALAAVTLGEMGYEKVASMAGGFRDWVGTGGDVDD